MLDVEELRSRRRVPGVPTARDRRTAGRVVALAVAALGPAGALIAWALAHLRDAHLARQATGEGLSFVGVSLAYLAATVLVVPAIAALGVASTRLDGRGRVAARMLAAAATAGLALCWAAAIWVEWHGDRCIGPCG